MLVKLVSKTIGVGEYADLDAENIISAVARHGVIKDDNGKLIRYLMDHNHWSPLQFVNFTFRVVTSRSVSQQLFRHDSATGKQEWSTRYADSVHREPIEFRKQGNTRQSSTDVVGMLSPQDNLVFNGATDAQKQAMRMAQEAMTNVSLAYKALLDAGIARETAREILPLSTKTIIHINASLRTWLSILNVRMDYHAQKEARLIAEQIGIILEQEMPSVFSAIDWRNGMFM